MHNGRFIELDFRVLLHHQMIQHSQRHFFEVLIFPFCEQSDSPEDGGAVIFTEDLIHKVFPMSAVSVHETFECATQARRILEKYPTHLSLSELNDILSNDNHSIFNY